MRHHPSPRNSLWSVFLPILAALALNACSDTNNVSGPAAPAAPGPLTILTASPLPAGTTGGPYDITLAPSGGTPPYTWSLVPGSPALPDGLVLTPSTGNISGSPTITGTRPTEFKLQDSKGESVQKILSMTVNIAPTPLTILTNSLPSGSINQPYAVALSATGGITPYTWGLKRGSSPLPSGLTLSPNGIISGTPMVIKTTTHIFTLTDATSLTIEKALPLSIRAIPLSITTTSLPQGTANQSYNETLAATGGTGAYTWHLAGGSPALPMGLTLNPSTGAISGIPTGTSNTNYTFTVTDQTPPTPQTATRTLQLIIGGAPPDLIITTNSPLPSGTVTQPYSVRLISTGGTGTKTWDISSGSLPIGLTLSSSGVISGIPTTTGTSSPTFRVRDSGTPQDTGTKPLAITITVPAAPNITTTSLPAGSFNVAYHQTVSVTGGVGSLVWGVTSGSLPPGLTLNASNGTISGTPTSTGSFGFALRVTDQIPQSDQQDFTIAINAPSPPSITSASSLPTGTVNQPYPNTQLTATGGIQPYSWSVNPALPNGLTLNPSSGVISGTPLSGSNGNSLHEFTVTDATMPIHQQGRKTLSLTIIANVTPVTITTASLPNGTVGQSYTAPEMTASGGTSPYTWSRNSGSPLPQGLRLSASGAITGTPTTAGTTATTFEVQDSTIPNQQSATKSLSITIGAGPSLLTITTRSLPDGTRDQLYADTLEASGGAPPYTWSVSPPLPAGLTLAPATGEISGTPTTKSTSKHDFAVRDTTNQTSIKELRLRIKDTSNGD
ncbi:MAG TPA: Ig domain-containing protein [Nitrospiraceae bacterium]|nr:Ig domain-containing protein [Nitrospiraceae bacterium]